MASVLTHKLQDNQAVQVVEQDKVVLPQVQEMQVALHLPKEMTVEQINQVLHLQAEQVAVEQDKQVKM